MQAAIRRRIIQVVVLILLFCLLLFGVGGQWDWAAGWAYVALYLLGTLINAYILLRKSPDLIAERGRPGEGVKAWDKALAPLVGFFGPFAQWLVVGLDHRFGWSPPLSLPIVVAGFVLVALGFALTVWAMAANRFFSGMVRIQAERGHVVVSTGPYRYVRHPGYAGMLLFTVATPFALSALWGLLPALFTLIGLVIRTQLEDQALQVELDGYAAYARRVRSRLLPGIW
ncbi:MAG: isoprenylcysteine carboxylmethyltransferase family protein [Anaerolineales bacterium]|nr:isoprenylcysteine carboxylmethyltransferase family protein [Anaerolineales bacterium]